MFEPALERLHGAEQPALVYVGDGVATAGEMETDGLVDRMRRSLANSRARVFCAGVGGEARHEVLTELSRAAGGQYFRVDNAEDATAQALRLVGAIKAPTITELELDLGAGLDQPFSSVSRTISRGEEVVWLARTHHPLPAQLKVRGRLGGKDFSAEPDIELSQGGVVTALVPRLWASEYVHRLLGASPDAHRAKVLELGLAYGLITPYTSSLALESEAAYAQQGITRRQSPLRGVHLSSLTSFSGGAQLVSGCARSDEPVAAREMVSEPAPARAKGAEGHAPAYATPEPARPSVADSVVQAQAPPAAAAPAPAAAPVGGFGLGNAFGAGAADGPGNRYLAGGAGLMAPSAGRRVAPARPKANAPAVTAAPVQPQPKKDAPAAKETEKPRERVAIAVGRCSDAASRPLAERRVLWKTRFAQAKSTSDLLEQYEAARLACEIASARDRFALLEIMQAGIDTEQGAVSVLDHFAGDADAQSFLARALLRRTTDARMVAAISREMFGERIDWIKLDRELFDMADPRKRLERVRAAVLAAPSDPAGAARYIRLLAETGSPAEALAYGRRMRDQGLITPTLVEELGDVLSTLHLDEEAIRTYSELVEYDASSLAPRRRLGDIYLRHGWYAEAYRQYKSLLTAPNQEPSDWLRLASAAAGAGRIDEALRVERDVAADAGRPGPGDPRYFSRLWSADRLALLLDGGAGDGAWTREDVAQKLKTLQLFAGPSTLALLTWSDLDARLSAGHAQGEGGELGETATDAGTVGLFAVSASAAGADQGKWVVRFQADPPDRAVPFHFVVLSWDGREFKAEQREGELSRAAKVATL